VRGVFNGLNLPGIASIDNGIAQSTPPDTTGSIGPNYYVEIVNAFIEVYSRTTLAPVTSARLFTWLGTGDPSFNQGPPLCDPQIQWDPSSQRWLYVVLECQFGRDAFLYGWSKTSDPTDLTPNSWCNFIQSTPRFLSDYPKLGHSSSFMLVGTNDYGDATPNPFITAQIFWMSTPEPSDASCTPPAVNSAGSSGSPLLDADGSQAFTPVPVNTSTNASDGYVVSAHDPSGPPPVAQRKLAVWHLDSSGGLHADGDLTVNTYAIPSPAPDLGGSAFGIDTLDGRLTQAVGDPTTGIYTQHTVNGTSGRSKVTWYEIQVVASVPHLTQEGDVSSATDFVFNGSISPRSDGQGAVIFYNRSSASIDPVIAAQLRVTSTPNGQMGPNEVVLATSTGNDQDFSCNYQRSGASCRWGDYSGASPDPLNRNLVWGSNQWLTPGDAFGDPNWATENYAISVPTSRLSAQSSPPSTPPARSPIHQSTPAPTPTGR
jgi:hypothetical protein